MEGNNSNPIELARQILRVFQEHKQAWSEQSMRPNKDVSWLLPPSNWIKLNFDAAIREKKTTIAVISRYYMGNTLKVWSDQFVLSNAVAASEGYENIILEGDAWNVIEPIRNADVNPRWSIKTLYDDILYFVKYFTNVKFSFVCREDNISAHFVA